MPIKILKAEDLMWISCEGFLTTGIFCDIVQVGEYFTTSKTHA